MSILNHSPLTSRRRTLLTVVSASLLASPCVAAGAFAVQVAVRQPAKAAAILQAAQPSASGQQLSATSGVPPSPAAGHQPSATSAMPPSPPAQKDQPKASDLPECRETVLVVAKRVSGQAREGAASKSRTSHDDRKQSGTGNDIELVGGPAGGVAGGVPGGVAGGVSGNPPQGPQRAKADLSGITEGSLIQLIEPVYPEEARAGGMEGDVIFKATIGKTGDLENLRTISGDPALEAAALDAVKQWKYEPYRFNSEPVEVNATITFKFRLAE